MSNNGNLFLILDTFFGYNEQLNNNNAYYIKVKKIMQSADFYIEKFIENQRNAIKFYLIFAISFLFIGIMVILTTFFISNEIINESIKAIIGIGGGFVSSVSAFPIKEVINRKEKIEIFSTIKAIQSKADSSEKEKIEVLVWKTIEKIALG